MDHSYNESQDVEESDENITDEESSSSISASDIILQIPAQKVDTSGVPDKIPAEDKKHGSSLYEDSWGVDLCQSDLPLGERNQRVSGNLIGRSDEEYLDSTEDLIDHSGDDYRQRFRLSKRPKSRDLQGFKHSNSNGGNFPFSSATGIDIDSQSPGPPGLTSLTRASSAPIDMPPPPTFMVAKSGQPISEWDLTSSNHSSGSAWSRKKQIRRRRRRPLVSLRREKMIDSIGWFSFHAPKCVLEDLISNELKKYDDSAAVSLNGGNLLKQQGSKSSLISSDDTSVSSLSDDEAKVMQSPLSDNEANAAQPQQCILKMPHSAKRDCALLFVDISGFTKLSTILDEESLSKVRKIFKTVESICAIAHL